MNEYSLADIAAVADGAGGNRGNGGGWGNGDGWWVLILIALLGGFNGGFGGWGGGGYAGGNELYPWLNQAQLTTQGFADQNAIMALNGISSGVQNLSTQLCNCCADMQMAVASGFANAETAANARQMANMQQAFNAQLATQQGFNGVQSDLCQGFNGVQGQLAAQTATILAENCADRAALSDGVRDIIASQTAGTQRVIDWLCQDKIDQKNDEIARLRQEAYMKDLAASQAQQNAFITQGFANEVDALYNRLNACPVPTTPVYGRTPIFTCPQNQYQGCGCGCGNGTLVG
jgi:hypothetical protein